MLSHMLVNSQNQMISTEFGVALTDHRALGPVLLKIHIERNV